MRVKRYLTRLELNTFINSIELSHEIKVIFQSDRLLKLKLSNCHTIDFSWESESSDLLSNWRVDRMAYY